MKKLNMLLFAIAILLAGCATQKESFSLGMIGGADGPTAIFITGDSLVAIRVAIAAVVAIIAILVFLVIRKNKK